MMNPVLRREITTSLRTWRTFWSLTIYVGLMAATAGIAVYGMMFHSYNYSFDPQSMVIVYVILGIMEMALVMIATPALTAGSISGEREKQTLDLLLVTKMSAFSIVVGKLMASLSILMLMLIASLPVFAIVFYFGGLSIVSLLGMIAFIMVTACTVGAVSIFFSCIFRRTIISVLMVYVIFGVLCFGTLIICAMYQQIYYSAHNQYPDLLGSIVLLAFNPGVGFYSVIDNQMGLNLAERIFSYSYYTNMTSNYKLYESLITHFWAVNVAADILITAVFMWLSTIFIRPVRKKEKRKPVESKT